MLPLHISEYFKTTYFPKILGENNVFVYIM